MTDRGEKRLFTLADRAFWLLWLAFPLGLWLLVDEVRHAGERLAQMDPAQAACAATLPLVENFGAAGQAVFWSAVAVEFAVYATLLFLAHRVIHRCAQGRVLVAEMIAHLRLIGIIVAAWPFADLALGNLTMAILVQTGDVPAFLPSMALDVTVVGFGVLMIVMAQAMAQAVRLREEADLTI